MQRVFVLWVAVLVLVGCTPQGDDDDDDATTAIFLGLVTSDIDPTQEGPGVESPWLYGGMDSVSAGDLMCADAGLGHVCKYSELEAADAQGDLDSLPLNTTGWVWRIDTTVVVDTVSLPPLPASRCVDYLDGGQSSDGEYFVVVGGGVEFHFDLDQGGVDPTDFLCGGQARAIPCCAD